MFFGIIALTLYVAGYITYSRAIISDTANPRPVSWFIWGGTNVIQTISFWYSGGSFWNTVVNNVETVGPCVIAALIVYKGQLKGGLNAIDWACLIGSAIACSLWAITGNPLVAHFLILAIEVAAGIPTIVNAWRNPKDESVLTWTLFQFGVLANVVEVADWSKIQTFALPVYVVVGNFFVTLPLLMHWWQCRRSQPN